MADLFGLDREIKIVVSGVRNVFTPHQPIQASRLFFGRQKEVGSLLGHLNTPGQHALLFGDRGVGKTSVANIAAEGLLKIIAGKLFTKRCDSTDTFVSIIYEPLKAVGIDLSVESSCHQKTEGGNAGLGIPGVTAGIKSETTRATTSFGFSQKANSPSWVAEQIRGIKGLLYIDEVDAIKDDYDKHLLAELVKQLSDCGSTLKVLVVGIAETSSHLTAGHPSVHRCLKETKLGRMKDGELRDIILEGQKVVGLTFSEQAVERIVSVSSGYPHFTHLLALKAAEDAIVSGKKNVDLSQVEQATQKAVGDAEGTLKKAYDDAVRSFASDKYKMILLAAVLCRDEEILAQDLRIAYENLWGEKLKQESLNNYLKRLVSGKDGTILRRLAKGVYRFNDPRMPSYIKIAEAGLLARD